MFYTLITLFLIDSMILLLENRVNFHYEIIESIIVKHNEILRGITCNTIYIDYITESSFEKYIMEKYADKLKIYFCNTMEYDYCIHCTYYPWENRNDFDYYICHEYHPINDTNDHIFHLLPYAKNNILCDILPFQDQINRRKNCPIYIIQGNFIPYRRDIELLQKILQGKYSDPFEIKICCNKIEFQIFELFTKYKNDHCKISILQHLDFIQYHSEFKNCYCIIPLVTKKNQIHYYTNKLTSSINYGLAYNLYFFIDNELSSLYKLHEKKSFVYREDNIQEIFQQSLDSFYSY